MEANIKSRLASGRFQVPGEEQCAQLQSYWDELSTQGEQLGVLEAAEPAITYTAWRSEDE